MLSTLSTGMLAAVLTLVSGVLAPVVALATVVLLPFSDRPTQAVIFTTWLSYVALLGGVLL